MVRDNVDLRVLRVAWNKLGGEGTNLLLRGMLDTGTLEEVDLSHTGVTDAPYEHVPGCNRKCLSIRPLPRLVDGCNGDVADGGGKLLAKVLHAEGSLTRIAVSGNRIGAVGTWAVASALSKNNTVASIDLSHNPLTLYGVRKLMFELCENSSLEELNLTATLAGPSVKDGQVEQDLARYIEDMRKRRDDRMRRGVPSREPTSPTAPTPRVQRGQLYNCPVQGVWPAVHTLWIGFPPRWGPPGKVTESTVPFEPDDLCMDKWRDGKGLAKLWPAPHGGSAALTSASAPRRKSEKPRK
eukprot:TRINITY_DN3551_c0_g1_i1.p3 TRINITY_DN3551_c0_g1~~TRINITY_DN3551_c0_g1_i1.p3  ORF type:complete len:296 (+),score=113.26 TRINITY_DN3551_c0_g1_i1:1716-2603(+)